MSRRTRKNENVEKFVNVPQRIYVKVLRFTGDFEIIRKI